MDERVHDRKKCWSLKLSALGFKDAYSTQDIPSADFERQCTSFNRIHSCFVLTNLFKVWLLDLALSSLGVFLHELFVDFLHSFCGRS